MRISSYQLGMDSERRYTSTQSSRFYREVSVSNVETTGSQLTPNLFNQFLPKDNGKSDCEGLPAFELSEEEPLGTKGLEDYLGKEDAIKDAYRYGNISS